MKRLIAKVAVALIFVLCLSSTALASDYETGWGKGLDNNEVEARAFLKSTAGKLCNSGDSDYEKVRKLNKYVCDNAIYDYADTAKGMADFVYKGKAVCSGYAETLAYLLDCVNIKNFTITDFVYLADKSKTLHIWNTVYIDGKWLHVDPTWNDAKRSAVYPNGKYFLITGAEISAGRQKLSFVTTEDYNNFYDFVRTVTVSFKATSTSALSGDAKQDLTQSAYQKEKDDTEPATDNTSNTEVFAMRSGIMLAPVRETAYALGGYVKQEEGGKVTIILGTKTLELTVGSNEGTVDGEKFTFDAAPQMINGLVMIPVRKVFEKLGATVKYDNAASEVTISYDPHTAT